MPCSLISHSYEKSAILPMRLNGAVRVIPDDQKSFECAIRRTGLINIVNVDPPFVLPAILNQEN